MRKKSVWLTKGQHTVNGSCGVRTQRRLHHWPSSGDVWVRACNVWLPQCPRYSINVVVHILERFSKPNIRFGSGRSASKIVLKFRLTHNRKLRSANRNTIDHTIACPALLLRCLAVENRAPQVSQRMFFVKLCKSGGLLLPSPRSLVIPWPTVLAHSCTDDGHVDLPAENLLPK